MRQVVLHPDPDDGGWVAEVPSLPGCASQGESREEAITNIREAIEMWIEAAMDNDIPIPDDTMDVQVCVV